jgi:hypothetical protein
MTANNENPSLITVTYGNQVFDNRMSTLGVFMYLRNTGEATEAQRMSVTAARKALAEDPTTMERVSRAITGKTPASTDGYEGHGVWYPVTMAQPDDTKKDAVLLLTGQETYRGAIRSQGALLIKLRKNGPLLHVGFKPCPHRLAMFSSVQAFYGRGDLLSLKEAEGYGVFLHPKYTNNFFELEEIEELFSIEEEAEELDTRPVLQEIKTTTGETKKIFMQKEKTRKLRIRQRS